MGFFSELDMEYQQKGYSRPFRTPKYAEYVMKYYNKRRKSNDKNRNKDNK
tara:strand:- start:60 stop:209 length:150 start_codon:yes stop_codon:yes gene_type:complete